jgi:DmsE family decaheme c-type cytochrome
LLTVAASCQSPHESTRRTEPNLDPGWPRGNPFFTQVSYQEVKGTLPTIAGAEYVNDDELCATCHGAYAKSFVENVHHNDSCEGCHGPASRHLETRGKEPGLIFSFKTGDPVARAEACLRCHEENNCAQGTRWRRSKHAFCKVTCVDCHRGHYNVPPGTPATTEPGATTMQRLPGAATMVTYQTSGQGNAGGQGYKPPARNLPSLRGTSQHMGAVAPGVCYRCHGDMQDLQQIAGPHQICGPNGFNCTTCHDPHGQILETSRKDLCLKCHTGAPTMAWHSSIHEHNGVACTDCHNPHPRACVPQLVNISHTNITRPKRLAMSVQEPEACYKCHPKIYGLNSLPSHHPIKEGKMVCSDCHDPHGQYGNEKNLKEATINLLCYKCHAEKQGPFAFEHPPVRENCAICHEPHGTVTNNLLRQPATFLCLRCHPGHNAVHSPGTRLSADNSTTPGTGLLIAQNQSLRQGFYTDCTQCHAQVHGTDRVSQSGNTFFTR